MKAKILRVAGATIGRKSYSVLCPCGFVNRFYVWSWAGHGKLRCHGPGCDLSIRYADLEAEPSKTPASPAEEGR